MQEVLEMKEPPKDISKSLQMDLFGTFITNDKHSVSNTIEFWEKIPKYFFSPSLVEKLRTDDGLAKRFKWDFILDGESYTVIFQPAIIEENGTDKAFFPHVTEELVEEALKKILATQNQHLHDVDNVETWVKFTLSMIYKELKERGKQRNRNQIKRAIEVLSGTIITLVKNNDEVWKGAILQDLVTINREKYIEDTNSQHIGRLPLFISHAINKLTTRQFNLNRFLSCDQQLSRWIYKRIIHKYTNANFGNSYHFKYQDLKNSGLLQQATERNNRRKVKDALDELVKKGVLSHYNFTEIKEGRKIVDITYEVFSSIDFRAEQMASNKRKSENIKTAAKNGLNFNLPLK